MITVNVTGHGNYVIAPDKLDELLKWLANNSMPVEGVSHPEGGKSLLNE
jgi:hypothetical protein